MKISKRKDRDLYSANVRKADGSYTKVYGKTKREVRAKYDEMINQIKSGRYVDKNPMTLEKWSIIWMDNYFVNLSNSTINAYQSYLNIHILPAFGERKIQSIKKVEIQGFVNKLSKSGLSPNTVKNICLTLHKMLNDAVNAEIISSNPADNIILPKYKKRTMEILSEEEVDDFLEMSNTICPDYTDIYKFFLLTGLRLSELIGLTFDRYNPKEHSILIDRQLNGADDYEFNTPKYDVIRKVYLSKPAEDIILKRKKKDDRLKEILGDVYQNKDGLVFTTIEGNHLTGQMIRWKFKKIREKINRPNLRIHDLRHTFATMALKSGMDIKTLQLTLGHSDASFTLNKYGHSTDIMQKEAASKYGDLFSKLTQN